MALDSDKLLASLLPDAPLGAWAKVNYAVHPKSQVLGQGSFGIVLAGNRLVDCMSVAVKIEELEEDCQAHQLSCAQLLQTQPHPNVLELLETFVDVRQLIFASVYPQALFDLRLMMRGRNGSTNVLGSKLVQALAADLTQAVAHLHGLHVIHRDIKPANCVIFVRPNCTTLKLGDFGCARVAQPVMTPGVTTSWYRAPELFRDAGGRGPGRSSYKESIDVWSLGCVVGEMLLCEELFAAASEQEVAHVIRVRLGMEERDFADLVASAAAVHRPGPGRSRLSDVKFPRSHSALQQAGCDFLQKCLKYDASERRSAANLIVHVLVHEHGFVCRSASEARVRPCPQQPPPLGPVAEVASAVAGAVQPANAAGAAQTADAVAPAAEEPRTQHAEQARAEEDEAKAGGTAPKLCSCTGFCRSGKNCHGSEGCKSPPTDGSKFCQACRCKAVKRKACAPPGDFEYSSGDEDATTPRMCVEPRSRGETCSRHRYTKFSLVLKACRRLGRNGVLDKLVPCDIEAFLRAPIHDDLVLQLIGAWIKHPKAIEALGRNRPKGRGFTAAALMGCLHQVPSP